MLPQNIFTYSTFNSCCGCIVMCVSRVARVEISQRNLGQCQSPWAGFWIWLGLWMLLMLLSAAVGCCCPLVNCHCRHSLGPLDPAWQTVMIIISLWTVLASLCLLSPGSEIDVQMLLLWRFLGNLHNAHWVLCCHVSYKYFCKVPIIFLTADVREDEVLDEGGEAAALGGVRGQVPAHDVLYPLGGQDQQNWQWGV